jgi:putative hemolysin
MPVDPFDVTTWADTIGGRLVIRAASPPLAALLGFHRLRRVYEDARGRDTSNFLDAVLESLGIGSTRSVGDLAGVPASGPLMVVANHPHGALDGLVLASLIRRVRPDVRLLANRLLARIPELQEFCFFVDPFDGPSAAARSRAGLRAAHLWLRRSHALVAFPSGEVAHRLCNRKTPLDSPWRETAAALAVHTGAKVLPAFIEGRNSALFYAAGRVHSLARTALLGRELADAAGKEVTVRIGSPIATSRADDPTRLTQAAREAVESLSNSNAAPCRREIAQLPEAARLLSSGRYDVYCARGREIPALLREIGHQRARAYHAAGEGTCADCDIDVFDEDYVQLFAWDRSAAQIVGAYRLADCDEVTRRCGIRGLYTRQLFDYDTTFLERLGTSVELGRSWVRLEYQRSSYVLHALWRAIGKYITERTTARTLFGAVSISPRYSDASHALIRAFLVQHHSAPALASAVAPCRPPRPPLYPGVKAPPTPASIDETDALVSRLEADGNRMPVLLRQYLKLNARVIAFSVDPGFGNAVDALMASDLTTVDRRILARYFGSDAATILAGKASEAPPKQRAA